MLVAPFVGQTRQVALARAPSVDDGYSQAQEQRATSQPTAWLTIRNGRLMYNSIMVYRGHPLSPESDSTRN